MLHIHNGDSTSVTMRNADFPGEHLAFREALALGPTPAGVTPGEWLDLRSSFLGGSETDAGRVREDLIRLDAALDNAAHHEEITLWFEHDLFCQINLSYLLARFGRDGMDEGKLDLICIGEYPGIDNFKGLGQLTAAQMGELFPTRHRVSESETTLAQAAWAAYCAADPREIERLLAGDTSAMPYLNQALLQHLGRFPSIRNGLDLAANKLLEFIADGETEFLPLCRRFFDAEPAYGLGDSQVWDDLQRLAGARRPLLTISGPDELESESVQVRLRQSTFKITDAGNEILNDKGDFIEMNGIDLWLGGVHLSPDNLWRWDDGEQELISKPG